MQPSTRFETLSAIVRARKTNKVLCTIEEHCPVPPEVKARHLATVKSALQTAGFAPFHYARSAEIAEPWRAYILQDEATLAAARYMRDTLQAKNKEVQLAAACSALVFVTWLPQNGTKREGSLSALSLAKEQEVNEEHIAATAAMVQNFLLLLTAADFGSYWSSGHHLRQPPMFQYLGIDPHEKLLAAVFIEFPEMQDLPRARLEGKNREKRCEKWIREVDLASLKGP